MSHVFTAPGSKTEPKMDPGVQKWFQNWPQNGAQDLKKQVLGIFFHYKKKQKFPDAFFLDFRGFREDRTLKIERKRCTVVQNRGYHDFLEKRTLCENTPKTDFPRDPRNHREVTKTATGPYLEPRAKKQQEKHENWNWMGGGGGGGGNSELIRN